MKNILKVSFVIIGTIIGAGFASGKEIYTFFNVYGLNGLIGLIMSNIIMGLIIYKTFAIVIKNNCATYKEFIKIVAGPNKKLNDIVNNIMNIFLLISFCVMVAGFGAYFLQELNLPSIYGAIIIAILSYITFFYNTNGIVKINEILIPLLILFIAYLGMKNFNNIINIENISYQHNFNFIVKSILYSSYNSIMLVPIIITLKNFITTKKDAIKISVIVTFVMLIMSLIIFLNIQINFEQVKSIEIPIIYIAKNMGSGLKYIYGVVILIAILTSAISAGYSFLNNVAKKRKQYIVIATVICIVSVLISNFGFSNLLNYLYPILGYLGIVQIFFLVKS